ncbi:hypothetical protein BJ165DRAFT_1459085 [Panaeolus papilionaceus]|nr:hypothetical protein BJ165DRAFT_1459085 [Panaeolus papilionaceus]
MKLWSPTNALNVRKLTTRTVLGQIRFESIMSSRRVGRPPCDRRVVTLDPASLVALQQAALDLSELFQPIIHTANGKFQIRYGSNGVSKSGSTCFPRGTRGFLYYHQQPDRPRISGQLRFRIMPSDDPASFSYGYDLKQPTSRLRPWALPLVCSISKNHILSQLENDGLIDHSLLQSLHNLHSLRRHDQRAHYLFTLFDPWEINFSFSSNLIVLRAVTELAHGEIKFIVPHLGPQRPGRVNFKSGVVKVCFEKSTLPQHRGKQVVLARCLDMLEPLVMEAPESGQDVNPVDLAAHTPIPGQVLQSLPTGCHLARTTPRPWSIDVSDGSTHPAAPGIRLLW